MRKAFSLIELSVVIVIISILLLLAMGFLRQISDRQSIIQASSIVQSQLNLSQKETLWCKGIFFFVDPASGTQKLALIRGGQRPPLDTINSELKSSYWERYADRFEIIPGSTVSLPQGIRCCRTSTTDQELLNTFVVVFNRYNEIRTLPVGFKYIVYDHDANGDELGDSTFLPVTTINGYWKLNEPLNSEYELYSNRGIENIISFYPNDPTERYSEFESVRSFFLYEHNKYPNFPVEFRPKTGTLFPLTKTKLIIRPVSD